LFKLLNRLDFSPALDRTGDVPKLSHLFSLRGTAPQQSEKQAGFLEAVPPVCKPGWLLALISNIYVLPVHGNGVQTPMLFLVTESAHTQL
jgi:hypothetical protein